MDELETLILLIAGAMVFSFVASIVNMLRINTLKDEVRLLRRQLDARTFTTVAAATDAPAVTSDEATELESVEPESSGESQVEAVALEIAPIDTAPQTANQRDTIESKIGGRWAVWLGGIALGLGGLFLVKYSIESGLISPAVRLMLATVFAIVLGLGGEYLRRKGTLHSHALPKSVSIPGLLTAAGSITLFGVIYVAHDFYGYIGSATTFILLALTALATIAVATLHGQSIASLGLLGAMIAPMLVSNEEPSAVILFGYLGITGAAAIYASKKPRWTLVPALAYVGLFIWTVLYLGASDIIDPLPPAAAFLGLLAITIGLWPGEYQSPMEKPQDSAAPIGIRALSLLTRAPFGLSVTLSSVTVLSALLYLLAGGGFTASPYIFAVCLMIGLAALGATRRFAVLPALFAAGGSLASAILNGPLLQEITGDYFILMTDAASIGLTLILALVFALCGFAFFKKRADEEDCFTLIWAAILALVPAWLAAISFANYGIYSFDFTHVLFGAALGLTALYAADYFSQQEGRNSQLANDAFVLLSFLSFSLSLHAISAALITTLLIPVLGLGYFLSARLRNWRALPWMMVPALLITMARFAWEPTIVGVERLWTTPVFNQLLPAYGVAAAIALFAAYQMRSSADLKLKNILQAFAAILSLLFAAVLIRHAMNHGQLIAPVPTLGEQSIYSLLMIGLSSVMLFLDGKQSSATLRYGSMLASVISLVTVLAGHLISLNPYLTGELTGRWPLINLILVAYLLPALGYAYIAYQANHIRPKPYTRLISASAALLAFVWVTLEVRHFWQGQSIAEWKGFTPSETYSYTVVWLLLGVALLALGIKREAMVLRLASAVLLIVATAKAFLFDMSNLEGALRALSFIGLGLVLMGIGLFYQRLLSKPSAPVAARQDESDIAGA